MRTSGIGHIFIHDLRLYAFHGVMPQEKRVGGLYSIDLDVSVDLTSAMQSDNVEDTVDYAVLCDIVKKEMEIPSALLEHVAGRIAKKVCCSFPVIEEVDVRLVKVNPPMGADCGGAGVSIHLINDKSEHF